MNGDVLTVLAIVGLVLFAVAVVLIPLALVSDFVRSFRRLRHGAVAINFRIESGEAASASGEPADLLDSPVLRELLGAEGLEPVEDPDVEPQPPRRRERDSSLPDGWGFD